MFTGIHWLNYAFEPVHRVNPLIQYVNMQKRAIERLIYERKEGVIRGLNKLYSEDRLRSK